MVLLKGFAIIVKRGKRRWVEMQRQYEKYQEQGTGFTATDIFGSKVQGSGFKGYLKQGCQDAGRPGGYQGLVAQSSQLIEKSLKARGPGS
jgi:hypothetical protein